MDCEYYDESRTNIAKTNIAGSARVVVPFAHQGPKSANPTQVRG